MHQELSTSQKANQYHQIEIGGVDTFERINTLTSIKLIINNGSSYNRHCDVYYLDDVTLGFDYGYEGQLFGGGGNANSLAIYTQLLENNEGVKLSKHNHYPTPTMKVWLCLLE